MNTTYINSSYIIATTSSSNVSIPSYMWCEIKTNWVNVLYTVGFVFILIGSVVGNMIVLVVFCLSKQLRSRFTFHFIVSLAISDMLLALTCIPYIIGEKLYDFQFCFNKSFCFIYLISDSLFNVSSILALLLIGIDRFIAIVMPFQYASFLNRTGVLVMLSLVWTFSFVWAIAGVFDWDRNSVTSVNVNYCSNTNYKFYVASFFALYMVPLIIMTIIYFIILKVAILHIKAIEATQVDNLPNYFSTINRNNGLSTNGKEKSSQKRQLSKELKATKSVAVVYFAFVICWFPSLVINLIIFINPNYFPNLKKTNKNLFDFIFYTFVKLLPMLNTVINPIIYNFFNKPFKTSFVRLYKRTKEQEQFNKSRQSRTQSLEGGISLDSITINSFINNNISYT
ncbi:5-hydroxytryptamine receptor 2B [Hydra vulgaris]|uniref:5-hydroxytryptamine receptor 2B n=1 Tax=Hydra vulgaris TaxID=6087 RepID=UPI001F5F98B5|nr:5-hydroxytryptamine receptor 2B [Hydra vulgaris]XP_012565016.2 5-hydroxytryptamine receptor 2B [Hydra vulgaris]XP_047139274.1 5-hydroxytryptamine receptor 2B [Hydra vulgaris]